MRRLLLLVVLAAVGMVIAGCSDGSSDKGEPIKPGDYTTEPGGANKAKTPGAQ